MSTFPLPIAAFFAGLVSFLSPCVLPLVPGYVSLISGVGFEELKRQDGTLKRSVMLNSLAFITGFSLVFITFGAMAGGFGRIIGIHLDLLTKIAGVIIIGFGLHQTGLLPIRALYADKRLHGFSSGGTAVGSFLVGFAFAFGWAPCAGPILAVILTFAASEATLNKGVILLAIYSLGLAIPFLLTSLGINRFLAFYARFRRHLRKLELVSGSLLVVVGLLIFTRHFALINSWLNNIPLFRSLGEKFL
jgi:cytochrome c-type biogenesis protein